MPEIQVRYVSAVARVTLESTMWGDHVTDPNTHGAVTESERLREKEGATAAVKPKRRRGGLSIQSKLLIMLLAVSLISSVIVGVIGFISGRESLRNAAVAQLTTIRELRVQQIEDVMAGA